MTLSIEQGPVRITLGEEESYSFAGYLFLGLRKGAGGLVIYPAKSEEVHLLDGQTVFITDKSNPNLDDTTVNAS